MRIWTTTPISDVEFNLLYDGIVVVSLYGCSLEDCQFIVDACNEKEQREDDSPPDPDSPLYGIWKDQREVYSAAFMRAAGQRLRELRTL